MKLIEIARAQLLTSVRLFFEDKDPISTHTLAGAASEILEYLCISQGEKPFRTYAKDANPNLTDKEYSKIANLFKNAFKHVGDTDKRRQMHQIATKNFDDTQNDALLYTCIFDYMLANKKMPIEFQVFQAWFCQAHPDKVSEDFSNLPSPLAFNNLSMLSRYMQKQVAIEVINELRKNEALIDSQKTER